MMAISSVRPFRLSAEALTRLSMLSIMVPPVLALLILAALIVRETATRVESIETQTLLVESSAAAATLITELQRERGTSSGYLVADAAEFGDRLEARRTETDRAARAVLATFEDNAGLEIAVAQGEIDGDLKVRLSETMALARARLDRLDEIRARVDALGIGRADMMRFYTDIIESLLTISDLTALSGAATKSDRLGIVIVLLEEAAELAGRERAAGAGGYATGRFGGALRLEMARLQAGQDTLLGRFRRIAPVAAAARLDAILDGNAGRTLDGLRAGARGERTDAATGPEWFDAATRVIDEIGALTAGLRAEQLDAIATIRSDLRARYMRTVMIAGAVLLLSVLLALRQYRRLATPIRDFATSLRRIGEGESGIEVSGIERRDLIGALARSVQQIEDLQSQRLRDVLKLAPIPTSVETIDGRLRQGNLAMDLFLGLEPGRGGRIRMPALRAFVEGDGTEFEALVTPEEAESPGRPREILFRRRDGSARWALVTRSIVSGLSGVPDLVVTQILDITETRELENTKSNFVSNVSHELRTPITSIRGAVSMVRHMRREAGDPTERRLLDIAQTNCERLLSLVNDLLDMDRLAQGGITLEMNRHEAGALCRETVAAIEPYAAGLGLRVAFEQTGRRLYTRTDAGRFNQVLTNLVSNALKFTAAGTTVRVAMESRGDRIRVSVADSGPGISSEFAPYLFERFRQGDGSSTRTYGGSGIGLHVCKGLVDLLGGEIGFENRDEGGARFWFTVPVMGVHAAREDVTAAADADAGLPVILHVEDDVAFADLFRMVAKPFARVRPARSLADAATMLSHEPMDLVLMDWELPDGSGVELLGHPAIAASAVPVVSLSASTATVRLARTQLDLVKSDGTIDEITAAIRKVLEEHISNRDGPRWRPPPKPRLGLAG